MHKRLKEFNQKVGYWFRKQQNNLIFVGILSTVAFLFVLAIFLGFFTIASSSVMTVFLEAQATILGFFGLFAVYILTSYDNRIDKIQTRIDRDKEKGNPHEILDETLNFLFNHKKRTTYLIVLTGMLFMIALFISLLQLGLLTATNLTPQEEIWNQNTAFSLSFWSSLSFLLGLFTLFVTILKSGTEKY